MSSGLCQGIEVLLRAVPREHRRTFLGQAAVAMLAAATAMSAGAALAGAPQGEIWGAGIRGDTPQVRAQAGKPAPRSIESRVIGVVARRFKVQRKEITRRTSFVDDLKARPSDRVKLKAELEKEFAVRIAPAASKDWKTVGQAVDHIEQAVKTQATARGRPANAPGKGREDKASKSWGGFFGNRP